jgi:hypothetical protein
VVPVPPVVAVPAAAVEPVGCKSDANFENAA